MLQLYFPAWKPVRTQHLIAFSSTLQVYELIASYMGKNSGALSSVPHELKLTFLRVLCDHDKYVEFPGRGQDERNYLASLLVQEVLVGITHEDPLIRYDLLSLSEILFSQWGNESRARGGKNLILKAPASFWALKDAHRDPFTCLTGRSLFTALAFLPYSPALFSDTSIPLSVQEQSCAADLLHHVQAPI
jgi:hypothetical protein